MPEPPAIGHVDLLGPRRSWALTEILLVLALSLGRSGVYSLVQLVASLTSAVPLAEQSVTLNDSLAPTRPFLDLTYQLLRIGFALMPVVLVGYLLQRSGASLRTIGADGREPARDFRRGAVLAAVVGVTGLAFYLLSYALGGNLKVEAAGLGEHWWRVPVLILAAGQNALLEEVVVVGFVLHRLRGMGWNWAGAIGVSAAIRGSYHLYQGVGGFLGNVAMGVLFGWLFRRWGRVMPLVVAHFLIDIGAFVGYTYLAGRVGWLP